MTVTAQALSAQFLTVSRGKKGYGAEQRPENIHEVLKLDLCSSRVLHTYNPEWTGT